MGNLCSALCRQPSFSRRSAESRGGDAIGVPRMFSVSPGHEEDCPLAGLELVMVPACPEPPAPTQGWVHRGSLQIQGGCLSCFLENCLQTDYFI